MFASAQVTRPLGSPKPFDIVCRTRNARPDPQDLAERLRWADDGGAVAAEAR